MFCKNCGAQINENQKFCPKCGSPTGLNMSGGYNQNVGRQERNYNINVAPNAATAVGKQVGKGKIIGIVVAVAALLLVAVIGISLIFGSGGKSDLVGSWEISEKEYSSLFNEYPEDDFAIYSDGTFFSDDMSGEYTVSGDTIIFDYSLAAYSFYYSVDGDTLKLVPVDDEESYILYQRVE